MFSPFLIWKPKRRGQPDQPPRSSDVRALRESQAKLSRKLSVPPEDIITTNHTTSMSNTISTDTVKELRNRTGISVMQCKKALEEAGGDMEKALVILRKKSGELSAKKADRTFGAGTVQAYIHTNGSVGAMVELDCETDFVSKNSEFQALAREIAMHVTAMNPKFIDKDAITEADMKTAREVFQAEVQDKPAAMRDKILQGKLDTYFADMVLLDQPFFKNPEVTIRGLIDAAIQKFGEKTAVARFQRFKILES